MFYESDLHNGARRKLRMNISYLENGLWCQKDRGSNHDLLAVHLVLLHFLLRFFAD